MSTRRGNGVGWRNLIVFALISLTAASSNAAEQSGTFTAGGVEIMSPRPNKGVFVRNDQSMIAEIDLTTGDVRFGAGVPTEKEAREAWTVFARAYRSGVTEATVEACAKILLGEVP